VTLPLAGQDDLLDLSRDTVRLVIWKSATTGELLRREIKRFPNMKHLKFGRYDESLNLYRTVSTSGSATHVSFEGHCSYLCSMNHLDAKKVKTLEVSFDFNHTLDDVLRGLETLTLKLHFNKPLTHMPPGVKTLTFRFAFNLSLSGMSQGVETLTFGHVFDSSLDGMSPVVKKLTFGCRFNQSLTHMLHTVKTLALGTNFHQSLTYLPYTAKYLTVGHYFNHPLPTREGLNIVRRDH
jgi:hypothetical protein